MQLLNKFLLILSSLNIIPLAVIKMYILGFVPLLENETIKFQVVFQCQVCNPSEGQIIPCIAKNITKAGIRAEADDDNNPLIIFIARDHNYLNKSFSNIIENQEIVVRVIGQRFELNDKSISVIADLVESKSKNRKLDIVDESSISDGLEVDVLNETDN